jgi:hypothetical protein
VSDFIAGIDVIVATPEEVERRRDTIGSIIRPAMREGKVMYAAGSATARTSDDATRAT